MNSRKIFLLLLAATLSAAFIAFSVSYELWPNSRETIFYAPALTGSGEGALVEFSVSSSPGDGKLLLNIAGTLYKEDTEFSLLKAGKHAQKISGLPFANRDFVIDINAGPEMVAGESAGAAFAIAIAASALNAVPRQDAVISAALNEENTLFPVGGVDEKILAAQKAGKKFFLVSEKQEIKYEKQLSQNISVIRVKTLDEAASFFLSSD